MKNEAERNRKCEYRIQRTGDEVAGLLDKIAALALASSNKDGLLSAADKRKLDSVGIRYNTTYFWNRQVGYIPKAGEIIIYSDYKTVTVDGNTYTVPGVKIGSGNAYVQDLMFINSGGDDSESELLLAHINDAVVHVTQEERGFWNNKLNVDDNMEVVNEALIFNRN